MYKKLTLALSKLTFVIIASVITTTIVFSFVLFQNNKNYNITVAQAKNNLDRLTQIVSSNIEIGFISVDQTLRRAVERQYFNILFGKTLKNDMEHHLKIWVNEVPHISAMMLTDSRGSVDIVFKRGEKKIQITPDLKLALKKHFEQHQSSNTDNLFISRLNTENNNSILASRRVDGIDGKFNGLVVAVIDGDYISGFINSIENERHVKVAVMLNDGTFLVEGNDKRNMFKAVVSDFNKQQSHSEVIERFIYDKFRLFSFKQLDNMPLSVLLTIDEDSIFLNWQESRRSNFIFAAIFAGFMCVMVIFSYLFDRQIKLARKSEQKALMASQTKSDFLAKMSHELRTPLNAIIGFSEMLAKGYFGKVTEEQTERLNDINMCGNHLLDLISDILDFSKGDAGKLSLKEVNVDLFKVTDKAVRMIEQKAKTGKVEVVNAVKRNSNMVYADSRKLKQIILNLLSNSIKFTPEGGKVIISTHFDEEKNIVITVSDTGIGIDSKDIPRAMQVFEQIHGTNVDEGTGLGLPLCEMFTQMHDGHFNLESTVGIGTTAYITLPKERVRQPAYEAKLEMA